MGKLLIFAGVILVVLLALALWGYLLQTRADAKKQGLGGAKKRMKALESENVKATKALTEIREIATSSETVTGDPLWSMVIDKIDEALNEEKDA
jgi:hypothetical protein